MSLLLDINVVSELMHPTRTQRWNAQSRNARQRIFFSAVGEAEVRYRLASLPMGNRKDALAAAIE